jgi:hypothetical protein
MATAPVSQAMRPSQLKAQTPVTTFRTPKLGQNVLMLLRSIHQIRIILMITALKNW